MSFKPEHPTRVFKNNIPNRYITTRNIEEIFGLGYAFAFDTGEIKCLYLQLQPFFHILEYYTKIKLNEFRTLSFYRINKRMQDEGFFELAYSFILSAIEEFNRHLKLNDSEITRNKAYTPIPSFENTKNSIRTAYIMVNFDRTSNN